MICANASRRHGPRLASWEVRLEIEAVLFEVRTERFSRFADEFDEVASWKLYFFSPRSRRAKSSTLLMSRVSRAASAVMICR